MARSISDTLRVIDEWIDSDSVGMLLIHKGPKKDLVVLAEETVKIPNLDAKSRAAVECLIEANRAFKVDVITGKDGPDRIKITRQL